MAQTSVDKIHDYFAMCGKVRKLNPKIRFAGVVNERGKLVAGGMQEGVDSITDSQTDEMLFVELALRVKMRQDFDQYFGKAKYTTTRREKVNVMSFPMKTDILFVFTESDIDICNLPTEILDIVNT